MAVKSTGCCEPIDEKKWDKKTHNWKAKPFYTKHYYAFFYVPLNFGGIVASAMKLLEPRGLVSKKSLFLCENEGFFGGDLLIGLEKDARGLPVVKKTGKYFSMYFEGGYRDVGKFYEKLKAKCAKRGFKPKEFLSYYATCPKCAKAYGRNQIVLLAKIN